MRLEQKDPDHFAVRQYKKFLLSAGKTRSSILISCGARLAPFDIREVRELMENDEMELDTIGDEKTVLFLIIRNISGAADIAGAIWGCMGYTVLLCFCLFKTGSISKSVFGAH